MKERNLLFPEASGSGKARDHDGQVSTPRPNMRWCSDGFEIRCQNREIVTAGVIMDCCDREIISYSARQGRGLTDGMVQDALILAFDRRCTELDLANQPLQFLSDNGAAYISKETQKVEALLGITDCKTPVRSPQSNGMAESLVRTLKRDYFGCMDIPDAKTALRILPEVIAKYNETHPHSALKYLSPREFRRQWFEAEGGGLLIDRMFF